MEEEIKKTPCYYCDHAKVCKMKEEVEKFIEDLPRNPYIYLAAGCIHFMSTGAIPKLMRPVFNI